MNTTPTKLRRYLYWGIGLALLIMAVFYALRPVPVLVDVAVVQREPMEVTVDEDGVTRIRERYVISTPLAGRLQRISFDVGDDVTAGTTIVARMEPTSPTLLDPREVAQARARVRAAERKLEASKASLAKAEAAVQFAESEMGRVRSLRDRNASSDLEFETRELEFRQSTEEARAAGFAVDIAVYELELEKAAMLLTDPDANGSSVMELSIKAPIDGRILRIYQESTAVLVAGSPLVEIGDPSDLEIVADVLSRDAVRIHAGNPVRLEHWGGTQPLIGRVRLVEPSGFTKLSALGVEEQRVNAIIDLVDPPDARPTLGDNFRVDCRIAVWRGEDVLQVPTSALFRIEGDWHVFIASGGIAKKIPIDIEHTNGQYAQVTGGLEPGQRVIVHPGDKVQDGVHVALR